MLIKSPPSALSALLKDDPRPRLTNLPRGRFSSATALEALEYVSAIGYDLDAWQNYLTALSLLETQQTVPEWYAVLFAYLVSRQNGKGGILTARSITDTFFLHQPLKLRSKAHEPHLVVYTAHQFKTASEAFERLKRVIDASPDLSKMMKKDRNGGVRSSALDKGFDLANGNRIRYLARASGGSGRGWSIPTLLIDEAQELPDEAVEALFDTQSAMPNPQRIMTGTVPDDKANSGEWTRTRDRGRMGSNEMIWAEYSIDPAEAENWPPDAIFGEHVDPGARRALEVNPAVGYRINRRVIAESLGRRALAYARERMSYWPDDANKAGVLTGWADLHDPNSQMMDPVAFTAEIAEDRRTGAIIATGVRADGLLHVEVVDYRPGTEWIADRLAYLHETYRPQVICLDVGGPAGSLASELEELDVPYRPLTVSEFGQACVMLFDQVQPRKQGLRWLAHGSALQTAISGAKWRTLGQNRAFDRRVDVDVSILIGVAVGVWAILTGAVPLVEVKPKAKQISHMMYGFN